MLEDENEFYHDLMLYVLGGYKLLETEPADPRSATERMAARPETSKRQSYIQPPTPDFSFGKGGIESELIDIREQLNNAIKAITSRFGNDEAALDTLLDSAKSATGHLNYLYDATSKIYNHIQNLFLIIENQQLAINQLRQDMAAATKPAKESWRIRLWKFEVRIAN